MNRNGHISIGAAALAILLFVPALRAEVVDSPAYKAWANYKVGSSATLAGTIAAGQMNISMEIKSTLLELTADHAVVETAVTMTIGGQVRSQPARKTTLDAKTEKKDWKESGTEKVEAAGKTFSCKVFEGASPVGAAGPAAASGSGAKIYFSDQVPGGLVQIKAAMPATGTAGAARGATFLLKSYEAK